jgi:hypothetical protein
LLLALVASLPLATAASCGDVDVQPTPALSPAPTVRPSSVPTLPGEREVTWGEAVELILSCEVTQAFQAHSLDVTLTLEDGTRLRTTEPRIDEVFTVVRNATAGGCDQIPLATE